MNSLLLKLVLLFALVSLCYCIDVDVQVGVNPMAKHHPRLQEIKSAYDHETMPSSLDEADFDEAAEVDEDDEYDEDEDETDSAASGSSSITSLAGSSSCAKINWPQRGQAPSGYIQGVALTFARSICNPTRSDVVFASRAKTTGSEDVLNFYNSVFAAAKMTNNVAGPDTLRHMYTLLIGLGMRESSGEYCAGRDMSSGFSSADSAEAGPFQTSYGSRGRSDLLEPMFESYQKNSAGCNLAVFKNGAKCTAGDSKNWGTGAGEQWQQLTKQCPAFAAEWAIVLLRVSGGSQGEWGPLRTKAAQVRPECDSMLQQVENLIKSNPNLCSEI